MFHLWQLQSLGYIVTICLSPAPWACGFAVTGNRCKHVGYDEFDPPSWNSDCAPTKDDWVDPERPGICGEALSYPEVRAQTIK